MSVGGIPMSVEGIPMSVGGIPMTQSWGFLPCSDRRRMSKDGQITTR